MKYFICCVLFFINSFNAIADEYVNGYVKKDGTFVEGHWKQSKNSTNIDNYSTQGNSNPYTGKEGSRAKDYSAEAHNYGSGRVIHEGSRGGQYYLNDSGKKVYVPKR